MRVLKLISLFILISLPLFSTTYYVATDGNDSWNGLDSIYVSGSNGPFLTWFKGFRTAQAGDTVYIRGGIYPAYPADDGGIYIRPLSGGSEGYDGTSTDHIVIMNYPGERPILDGSNIVPSMGFIFILKFWDVDYWDLIGLEFQNFKQASGPLDEYVVQGISLEYNCNQITFDRCVVHDIGGNAFTNFNTDTVYYNNCDMYNLCDSLGHMPGNYGTGISVTQRGDDLGGNDNALVEIHGCRAWNCSDQGFSSGGAMGTVSYDSCWSFLNGAMPDGGGHGWKLGYTGSYYTEVNGVNVILKNSIAAYNRYCGITSNDRGKYSQEMNIYNNSIYHNGYGGDWSAYDDNGGYGFVIYSSNGPGTRILRNNISYANEKGDYLPADTVWNDIKYNSWQTPPGVTVNDLDFVLVDSAAAISQLKASRKANGSLPDITFLKLETGSDLIDVGVDVGYPYNGDAPDLGYAEYGDVTVDSTATDITSFILSERTGPAVIDTVNHTVSIEIDFIYDITDLTPSITMSYGATISPLSGVSQDFTSPVVYTVTALDGVTEQEWTVTVTETVAVTSITVSGAGGATTINTQGGTLQMSAVVLPNDAENKDITWSVIYGTGQALISLTGLLEAKADGTVTVRATADDGSGIYGDKVITISGQSGLVPSSKIIKYRGLIMKR